MGCGSSLDTGAPPSSQPPRSANQIEKTPQALPAGPEAQAEETCEFCNPKPVTGGTVDGRHRIYVLRSDPELASMDIPSDITAELAGVQDKINAFFAAHPQLSHPDSKPFSHFKADDMRRALNFTEQLYALMEEEGRPLWKRLKNAMERFFSVFGPHTTPFEHAAAQEGLGIFLVQHPVAKHYLHVPTTEEAFPDLVVPSKAKESLHAAWFAEEDVDEPTAAGTGPAAGAPKKRRKKPLAKPRVEDAPVIVPSPTEDPAVILEEHMDWFREDPLYNYHHEWWHRVNVAFYSPLVPRRDRQGELFLYMHEQMLARYDTERLCLGLERVEPFNKSHDKHRLKPYDPYNSFGLLAVHEDAVSNRLFHARAEGYIEDQELLAYLQALYSRLESVVTDNKFVDAKGTEYRYDDYVQFADRLGSVLEAQSNSAAVKGFLPFFDHYTEIGDTSGGYHNMGHVAVGRGGGVMMSTATAIRDPVFYEWHRHVDDFYFRWQEQLPPQSIDELRAAAAKCTVHGAVHVVLHQDINNAQYGGKEKEFGEQTFGGGHWDKDYPQYKQLQTKFLVRPLRSYERNTKYDIPYLDNRPFSYFIRIENPHDHQQEVTVRVFLCLEREKNNRRMWIEMDKFREMIAPLQKRVVQRSSMVASVARKPYVALNPEFSDLKTGRTGQEDDDNSFCECGWPNNLLVPRGSLGTPSKFVLAVMLTDNTQDRTGPDTSCGSMSYCGTKDSYPDAKPMGYPFHRRLPVPVTELPKQLPAFAVTEIGIQCENGIIN